MISLLLSLATYVAVEAIEPVKCEPEKECKQWKETLIDPRQGYCHEDAKMYCHHVCYRRAKGRRLMRFRRFYRCTQVCDLKTYCDVEWIEFINSIIRR